MKKFLIRRSCDYSIVIEAETADEAMTLAEHKVTEDGIPNEEWGADWSSDSPEDYEE